MVVFSNYSVQVIMSFLLMSMVFVLWPRADVSAQRVLEVLDTDPIVKTGTKTAADVARLGGEKTGTVEFRNVSFTYPAHARRRSKASTSPPKRARPSRSSAPPAPASPASSTSCRASTTCRPGRCSSTVWTCANTI